MNIIIQSPGFKASDHLESFIHEKMDKLDHMGQNIVRADVTLFSGPPSDPDPFHCEIRLEVPGNDHFVKKAGPTYEEAILNTIETLQKVMQKAKDRFITRRHPGAE